jgi:hypothetical protein
MVVREVVMCCYISIQAATGRNFFSLSLTNSQRSRELRETPRRGGRQQPHQTLKKSKKYKGVESIMVKWDTLKICDPACQPIDSL